MPVLSTLQVLIGVPTLLGLAAVLAYLWFLLVDRSARRAERSIRERFEGNRLLNTEVMLEALRGAKTDDARERIFERMANLDRETGKQLVDENQVALKAISASDRQESRTWSQRLLTTAIFFILLLVIVALFYALAQRRPEPVVPAPAGSSSAPPVASPVDVRPRTLSREFESGNKRSGANKEFSPVYEVCTRDLPEGYRIESQSFRLVGDRSCGGWATCSKSVHTASKVCYSFTLQGREGESENGVRESNGILSVELVRE